MTPEAMARLMAHDFPGNIRELENIVEYASVVCRNQWIGLEHLPDNLNPAASPVGVVSGSVPTRRQSPEG